MQLFGTQNNHTFQKGERRHDLLGTNFMAFQQREKQEGWQLQMHTPLRTKEVDFNFFNKTGRYDFLYGNPAYGVANPFAAGKDK